MTDTPVIVLNWEGWDDTLECLRSLREAPDVTTVWLVDNGSSVDRSEEARAVFPGLRVERMDRNYGFTGGMNRAMRIAAAERRMFVYLLNNDTTVVPGFLSAALEAATPNVALVGSRILAYGSSSGAVLFDGDYLAAHETRTHRPAGVRAVPSVNGAGMLVRIAAVEPHGYFDERLFCYHEEAELCERLAAAGWSFVLADASRILHKRHRSDFNSNGQYYRVRNRFLMLDRHRGWRGVKRGLRALQQAATAGRLACSERNTDKWLAVAAGLYDGIKRRTGQRGRCENVAAASALLLLACSFVPNTASRGAAARHVHAAPRAAVGEATTRESQAVASGTDLARP